MQIPTEPESGQPCSALWGRQVVRALRAIWPRPSADVYPRVGAGGTTFSVRFPQPAPQSSPPAPTSPLELINATTYAEDGTPTYQVRVVAGAVGLKVPDGMSPGDDPQFILPISADSYIVLTLSVEFHAESNLWTLEDVSIDAEDAIPDTSTGTAVLALGSVSIDTDAQALNVASNNVGFKTWARWGDTTNYIDIYN